MSSLTVHTLIGAGGYGQVYHATWKKRKVAVKKFFVVQDDVQQTADIQREVDILKTLVDRHIIQFYGTVFHEGMLVVIMDYAEGGSLQRAINNRKLADWSVKTRIAQEIAQGLSFIHEEGVIHRDLKSLNVLLTRLMEVKLCDFGLATVKVRSAAMSTTLKGTFRWMAPELFALKPKYSTKSDMYALGMVMWEMAANCTMPFKEQADNHTVMTFVTKGEREQLPDDTPDDYRKWVERCWAQDPLERPEASEMVVEEEVPDAATDQVGAEMSMLSLTNIPGMSISLPLSEGTTQTAVDNVEALRTRAGGGDVDAQMALAEMYAKGAGIARDASQAFNWYLRAAEQGSIEAQWKTGFSFYYGRGTPQDNKAAESWIRKAAESGHPEAENELGRMYAKGHGVAQDSAMAMSWYLKAATKGNATAQWNLGYRYEHGDGVDEDDAEAVSWYRKSAEQENSMAQYRLALCYDNGTGVDQDSVQAVFWFRKAAEHGSAAAQYQLGLSYDNGEGVEQDDVLAASWYLKAAKQGFAAAQYNLGLMYDNGQGVEQSYSTARSWYLRSANQGSKDAQYNLGWMYDNGEGVDRDYYEAASWYQKSADKGHAEAQFNLGLMYQDGRGVGKDVQQAIHWYQKAADQGDDDAKQRIKELQGLE